MTKREMVLTGAPLVGLACLVKSFTECYMVIADPPYVVAAISMWRDGRAQSLVLIALYIAVAAVPVFLRKRHAWLPPLLGAVPVISFGLVMISDLLFSRRSCYRAFPAVLFTLAGVMLLVEALMSRHMRPAEQHPSAIART